MNLQKFIIDIFHFNYTFTMNRQVLIDTITEHRTLDLVVPEEYNDDIERYEKLILDETPNDFAVRFKDIIVNFTLHNFSSDDDNSYMNIYVKDAYVT